MTISRNDATPRWQDLYLSHKTPDPHTLSPQFAERRSPNRNVTIAVADAVVLLAGIVTVAAR